MYSHLLKKASWSPARLWALEETSLGPWLLESESLSRRLAEHCQSFTVTVLEQKVVDKTELSLAERELLGDCDCLIRKVILNGDQQPWVFASTLIPLTTLSGEESDLADLGTLPLGYRVFSGNNSHRDAIEVANIGSLEQPKWARRSRLWINEKPMLVAELFLPSSPVYAKDDEC